MSFAHRLTVALSCAIVVAVGFWRFGPATLLVRPAAKIGPALADAEVVFRVGAAAGLVSRNEAPFESGNIGPIERHDEHTWRLQLRGDNDDALPKTWRQWFYLKLDDVATAAPTTIDLEGGGFRSYYLPFYSYDNTNWIQFSATAVTQPTPYSVRLRQQFRQKSVWLARYIPYPYSRMMRHMAALQASPYVHYTEIGQSPEGRPVPLLTIGDFAKGEPRARVEIHARTHPGEVGSSFLLEGLLNFLTSEEPAARNLRRDMQFVVLPMLNIDGVVCGNNRVTPRGINLEGQWHETTVGPGGTRVIEASKVPPEVALYARALRQIAASGPPFTIALNLHASAGEPEDKVFMFPHFGPETRGYAPAEARLFAKQISFMQTLASLYGQDWLSRPPAEGGREFLAKAIPETWWWHHSGDGVMALTLESTYGLAGKSGRWVKPDDMRRLGAAVALAIGRYNGLSFSCRSPAHAGVKLCL